MGKFERLRSLRGRVPKSRCPDGCYECCKSGVSVSHTEMCLIPPPAVICTEGCGWLTEGKCGVYEARPFRCRTFGLTDDKESIYYCPIGCEPERALSDKEIVDLINEYESITANECHTLTVFGVEAE